MRRNVAACIADVMPLYSNTACPAHELHAAASISTVDRCISASPQKGVNECKRICNIDGCSARGGFFLLKQPRNSSYKFVAAYF